ncbi:myo-inosose-2 dehydratase [Achromobacter sp. ESBL13]|uniref:myo-inosose-2 dehydratase n=1 Tax=Achromobacter sp. ESBL13 TaxID=3077328 RepID=UPI002FC8B03F
MNAETTWNVRIGVNPISWSNDDLPSLGGDTPLSTALSEGARIGYAGFELGNKFPRSPQHLKAVLARHGVVCVSGWHSGRLAHQGLDAEIRAGAVHMEKLRAQGCNVVVYGEVADSIQGNRGTPLAQRPRWRCDASWNDYGKRLNAYGAHLKANYGLTLAYHHHMGAYVETADDVDRLMAVTDENVGLLFDTGHCYLAGAIAGEDIDVVARLARHADRVVHVHCKDVRPGIARAARNEGWSFLDAVMNGVFTVPGDGCIDFGAVLATLRNAGYEGWLVVEAEQDPAVAPPYQYAKLGYQTLSAVVRDLQGNQG